MASENPLGENNPTPNAEEKSSVKPDGSVAGVAPAISASELPPSHCHYEITCKPEKDWWDKNKKWVEIAGVILLGIYTVSTILMYCANKKAADAARDAANATTCAAKAAQEQVALMKQQLVGTQAAIVKVADYPSIYPLGNLFRVDLAFANSGHVLAKNIRMSVKVRTLEVKTGKEVDVLANCSSHLEVLAPEDKPRKVSQPCGFPVGSQKWASIPTLIHTIAIDGTFSYWNGFEESGPQEICLRYVPNGVKTAFGANEGDGRFLSCRLIAHLVCEVIKGTCDAKVHLEMIDQSRFLSSFFS